MTRRSEGRSWRRPSPEVGVTVILHAAFQQSVDRLHPLGFNSGSRYTFRGGLLERLSGRARRLDTWLRFCRRDRGDLSQPAAGPGAPGPDDHQQGRYE